MRLEQTTNPQMSDGTGARCARAVWALSLLFLVPVLHAFAAAEELLQYDRAAVDRGQLWRLVTCHLTHWSVDHLVWSGGAFAVLVSAARRLAPRRTITCVAASAVVVGWAVHFFTSLPLYRGLSGIDSALFVLVAVALLRSARAAGKPRPAFLAGALLLGFAGKLLFEMTAGRAMFVDAAAAGMTPVPLAHAAGAIVGLLAAIMRKHGPRAGRLNEVIPSLSALR
jgi:rhomboid family GlyGly-CTERM serine protease